MTTQPARNVIVTLGDAGGPETFTEIGDLDLRRLTLNGFGVDATNETSANWRSFLPAAGLKSARIEGYGAFKDSATERLLQTRFFSGALPNMKFYLPSWGTLAGSFLITTLDFEGRREDKFRVRSIFESSGALTFTSD